VLLSRGKRGLQPGASRELSVCPSVTENDRIRRNSLFPKELATNTVQRFVDLIVYWFRLHKIIRRVNNRFLPKNDVSDYSNLPLFTRTKKIFRAVIIWFFNS
jgi:hypothetical protein